MNATSPTDIHDVDLVTLIHPLGVDHRYWDAHRPLLGDVRLHCPDLPGHGSAPAPDLPAMLESISARIARDLERNARPSSIAGVSIGGLVAQQIAISRPELVDRLVLIDTVASYPSPFDEMWRSRAAQMREHGAADIVEATLPTWFTDEALAVESDAVEYVRTTMLDVDPEGYARSCDALFAADTRARLDKITAPTLVLCGDHDAPLFVEGSRELVDCIDGAQLAWIPGKHGAAIERPIETARLIRDFVERR